MVKHLLSALCMMALMALPAQADRTVTLYGTQYSPSSALVAFDPATPAEVSTVLDAQDEVLIHGSVAAFDGQTLYVFSPRTNSSTGNLTRLTYSTYTLSGTTWTLNGTRQLTADYANYPNAMAYDPASGNLYGYRNGGPTTLYTIDKQTGAMTAVRSLSGYFTSIAFDRDGNCYAFDFDCQLNKLDIATGVPTALGSTGQAFADKQPTYIDATSGTMYWVLTKTNTSALFTVNLATGAATKVGDMGDGATFSDVFAAGSAQAADEQAPDACTSLIVEFATPGGLASTLKATAPTLAFDKQTALTGTVSLSFYVDDAAEPVATVADVKPGATATASYTFATTGEHSVKVVASNANGNSPAKTITTFAGYDTPAAPANVSLTISADGKYSLTWDAPTQGQHGGAIRADQLYYTVTQYPAAEIVGTSTTTSFTGQLTTKNFATVQFGVKAGVGTNESAETLSNTATYGDYAELPFYDDFTDSSTFGLYTIVNVNGDATWAFGQGNVGKAVVYNGAGCSNTAEDYLILPPMKLVGGVTYSVTFQAASGFNQDAGNHMDVVLLSGTEGTTQQASLASYTNIADYTAGLTETTCTYTATADAAGRFAFICRSNAGKKLCLYNVYVSAQGYPEGPADVTELYVEAGAKGAHRATVSFNAPETDVKGQELKSIERIAIYRDAARTATHTLTDVVPGDFCEWTDDAVGAGTHTYRVVAYTDKGASSGQSASVLVGQDIPTTPRNFAITEETDYFLLTWDAPTSSANGGYIDYENLSYSVYYSYGLMENPSLYEEDIHACQLRVPKSLVDDYASAHQILLSFLVLAETENGYSSPATADIVYGAPYSLPFSESFAYGQTNTEPWGVLAVSANYVQSWSMITGTSSKRPLDVLPADDDNGMAMFYHASTNGYEARLLAPQVNIEGVESPVLTLSVYHINSSTASGSSVTIEKQYAGSSDFVSVGEPIQVQGETGWRDHKFSLLDDSGNKRFRIVLRGKADNLQPIFVDNLRVTDEEFSAISSVASTKARAYSLHHSLVLEAAGADYRVLSTAGHLVAQGTLTGRRSLSLAPGIYLVQLGDKTMKCVVK